MFIGDGPAKEIIVCVEEAYFEPQTNLIVARTWDSCKEPGSDACYGSSQWRVADLGSVAIQPAMRPGCVARESAEQTALDLHEANQRIERAGEHPSDEAMAEILTRLERAAYAGNIAAQVRFGQYVVGYYFTDEMFWPRRKDVAIAALAMLRVAALQGPVDPRDPLMVELARTPVDLRRAEGIPPLPASWVKAALVEAALWQACSVPVGR